MAAATAPECLHMQNFIALVRQMPVPDNGASISATSAVFTRLHSKRHMHVYTMRVSVGEMLHIGAVINSYYNSSYSNLDPGAIIIVDDVDDDFHKVSALVTHLTGESRHNDPHSTPSTHSFSRIVVLRGPKPAADCSDSVTFTGTLSTARDTVGSAVTRLRQKFCGSRVIWHSHADPSLITWALVNDTTLGLDAITVFDALRQRAGCIVLDNPNGNKAPNPWPLLINAVNSMNNGNGIPLLFASNSVLQTELNVWSTAHLRGLKDTFPTMLPFSTWITAVGQAMDSLIVGAFRLWAGGDCSPSSPVRVRDTVVAELRKRLSKAHAGGWSSACFNPESYTMQAIQATVQGALPSRNQPRHPLPTFAALTNMVNNPLPSTPASPISRLVLGPHAPDMLGNVIQTGDSSSTLWAIRTRINPRQMPLPPNTPNTAVSLQIVPQNSNLLVLATPRPDTLNLALCSRWSQYLQESQSHARSFPASTGGGTNGFGIPKSVAEKWCAIVSGLFVSVVEEWARAVTGTMSNAETQKLNDSVRQLAEEARTGVITRLCQRALRG